MAEAGSRTTTSRPLRVALVHTHHWDEVRRGGERYLSDLAWYLGEEGHKVEVIVSGRAVPAESEEPEARVTLTRTRRLQHRRLAALGIGANETLSLSAFPRLLRRRFDVVHCLLPMPVLAARAAGQRVVYTEIGHPTREWNASQFGGLALYRAVVRSASAVTALSATAAAGVEEVGGRKPTVLPPGVRLDHFAPVATTTSPPRVLFVSDASERRKGLDVAVAAVAKLRQRRPDVRLVIAGPGDASWALDQHPELEGAVDVLGVGDRSDLPKLYASSAVTMLPSTEEAFGLVLIESLACGTPVVASDVGGMRDIVTSEVGRLAPSRNADALAAAIEDVLSMQPAAEVAQRCRERATEWGWRERVGPAHVELYRSVAR